MRLRLIHWHGAEGRERQLRLASLGHQVEFDALDGPALLRRIRANLPEVFVIDLSRLPAHGREVGMWLRTTKSTREVPLVFVGGPPEKVAKLRALLPDAFYTTWGRIGAALIKAHSRPPSRPVVPPSAIYTGRSTVEKLGIKEGMQVCVTGAPPGFSAVLSPMPRRTRLTATPSAGCDLYLAFARSRHELGAHLARLACELQRQTLWLAWPKKASGVRSDVTSNVVRETGLFHGLVDFKVCSLDETWSALAFKRRK